MPRFSVNVEIDPVLHPDRISFLFTHGWNGDGFSYRPVREFYKVVRRSKKLDKLAKDYEDCSDLLRTLVSESHTDIFNGIHQQYSSNDISYVQNGRYHHISTGFEVNLQNWYFGTNFHFSGGGDTVYFVRVLDLFGQRA